MDENVFRKQNSRRQAQERLLYECRNTMKADSSWIVMNNNGKCEDYILLINNIKQTKQYVSKGVNKFILNCNMWKPCLDTFERVLKMYGFYIDKNSLERASEKTIIEKKKIGINKKY